MTFLNAVMALGAAAFVVPLAIHLLFRSRYRSLDWGAMFLLQDGIRVNRRRMQWHQWVLLAIRCAIPILLALAMARPLISSVQSIAGDQPVSWVLLIDDSRSMSAGNRSTRAIAGVTRLLDSMSRGDEVMIIPASRLAAPVAIGSPDDARSRLRQMRFDSSRMNFIAAVQSAAHACRRASHPFRRIVVVSDFQENVLGESTVSRTDGAYASAASLMSELDSISDRLARIDPAPQVDFLDVGLSNDESDADADPDAALANVLIKSIRVDVPAVMVDQTVPVVATIQNDSDVPVSGVRANWLVGNRVVETEVVSIDPRGTTELAWQTSFSQPGGTSVGLAVEHTDALMADNRRMRALQVRRPVDVWLVDGDWSDEPLQSETDFLQVALSPFAFGAKDFDRDAGRSRDLIATKVIRPNELASQWQGVLDSNNESVSGNESVERYNAFPELIVFANVKSPPEMQRRESSVANEGSVEETGWLGRYLAMGGRVMFFDGDNVDPDAWNSAGILPAKLDQVVATPRETEPMRIEPPGATVDAWQLLGSERDSLFDSVRVSRYRRIGVGEASRNESGPAGAVMLRSQSGRPLVVSGWNRLAGGSSREESTRDGIRRVGVVQFAIPCDTAWSNLPLRPVFLPMVQQLVLDLIASDRQLTVRPGTAMVVFPEGSFRTGAGEWSWEVYRPDGETQTIAGRVSTPLVYGDTHRVGAYRFVAARFDDVEKERDRGVAQVHVVEVEASESVLRRANENRLDECAERLGASRYQDAEALIGAVRRDRFGTEIWRPL
ncbi:MAG: BatA domain-containing protein, partial [Rhodopirellula sp. JB053]